MKFDFRNIAALFILLFWAGPISSQDSLLTNKYKEASVEQKINFLNDWAFELAPNDFDQAHVYATTALFLADSIDNTKLMAKSHNRLGVIYYFLTAYDKALESYYASLKISEENIDSVEISRASNNIGLVYSEINSFENALKYYRRALDYITLNTDYYFISNIFNNIGIIYRHQQKIDSAFHFYNKALIINKNIGDIRSLAKNRNNLGNLYNDIEDYKSAEIQYREALFLNRTSGNNFEMARNYINLSDITAKKGDYTTSQAFLDSSRQLLTEIKSKDIMLGYYMALIDLRKNEGRFEVLPPLYEDYISLHDSLYSNALNSQLQKQHSIYEISKKNNEIAVLKAKNQLQTLKISQERTFRISFIIASILLLVILILMINRYRIKSQMSKRLEKKVDERTRELEQAKDKAELSDRLKTSFLANMSHEIRTPMNAIVGFSSILGRENLPPKEKEEYQKHVNDQSKYLLRLLNDILDASKIESGDFKLKKISFDLQKIIYRLQKEYEQRIAESKRSIKLRIKPCERLTDHIFFDSGRLYQVLDNLLDNALKFTEKGEILLEYKLEEGDPQKIVFRVKDTGIGIPIKNQDIIFQRFRQVDETSTRKYGGTGIGLAVCKGILQYAGCDLNVKSSPGKGTEFSFSIPYNPDISDELKDISSYKNSFKGKSILIVEDDKLVCDYIRKVLGETGAVLKFASNGREALQMVKKKNGLDLILMDIRMPEMNGYEAARAIKELRTDIPIIAQTAYIFSHDEETSLQNGYDDYLPKPIRPRNLMHMLNKYLS